MRVSSVQSRLLGETVTKAGMAAQRQAHGRRRAAAASDVNLMMALLIGYRYLSWLLTSALYLFVARGQHPGLQAGVVCSLLLAAVITQRLHRAYWGESRAIRRIVTLETLATLVLLLPTGGLDSVFIWYAINPLLSAATMLSLRWSLILLAGFLGAAYVMSELLLPALAGVVPAIAALAEISAAGGALPAAGARLYIVLIFVLMTAAVQMLAALVQMTRRQNRALYRKSVELKRALRLRGVFYQLIERLAVVDDRADIAPLVASTCQPLLEADGVTVAIQGERPATEGDADVVASQQAAPFTLTAALTMGDSEFGRITAYYVAEPPSDVVAHERAALQRVAELTSAALERLRLEQVNRQLTVAAEQQRIAAELHDSVASQLFNISTACYVLRARWQDMSPAEIIDQLTTVGRAAGAAARALRRSIYALNEFDAHAFPLSEALRQYAQELAQIHGVDVRCECDGPVDDADHEVHAGIMRIVREAAGNALLHGACSHLTIRLDARPHDWRLVIRDDGRGFDRPLQDGGIGLGSMQALARKLGGSLRIRSRPGRGTLVIARLPRRPDNTNARNDNGFFISEAILP